MSLLYSNCTFMEVDVVVVENVENSVETSAGATEVEEVVVILIDVATDVAKMVDVANVTEVDSVKNVVTEHDSRARDTICAYLK